MAAAPSDYKKLRLQKFAPVEERETPEGALCARRARQLDPAVVQAPLSRFVSHGLPRTPAGRFWRKFKLPVVQKLVRGARVAQAWEHFTRASHPHS